MKKAMYPGFFDPLTMGHVNIVERASKVFDQVIVGVAKHSHKNALFSFDERYQTVQSVFQDQSNIIVEPFEGLLVNYLKAKDFPTIIRGLRTVSDFEYEFQMALANKAQAKEVETFFMMTDAAYSYMSSTIIKEVARLGGDVSQMVPPLVFTQLQRKFSS